VGASARRALRRVGAPARDGGVDPRRPRPARARLRRRQLRDRERGIRGRAHRSPARLRVRREEAGAVHDGRRGVARASARGPAASVGRLAVMSRLALFGPLLLVVGGSVMYHVAAKSVPKTLEPFAALVGVYTTALV